MYWIPRSFPLGLDGLMAPAEPDLICPVCGEIARYYEKRRDAKRVYHHKYPDFCVQP